MTRLDVVDVQEEETLQDLVLSSVKKSGSTEEEIWDTFQKICQKKQVLPLYGQLVTALRNLKAAGKVYFRNGRTKERLLHKA
jgi:hypothetical protein